MLGQRIMEQRTNLGWNQVILAKKLGVAKQTVSNWENENVQPSIDMLIRLAKVFHVTTDYLLGLDEKIQLDVSGLPTRVVSHIALLIDDYKQR